MNFTKHFPQKNASSILITELKSKIQVLSQKQKILTNSKWKAVQQMFPLRFWPSMPASWASNTVSSPWRRLKLEVDGGLSERHRRVGLRFWRLNAVDLRRAGVEEEGAKSGGEVDGVGHGSRGWKIKCRSEEMLLWSCVVRFGESESLMSRSECFHICTVEEERWLFTSIASESKVTWIFYCYRN